MSETVRAAVPLLSMNYITINAVAQTKVLSTLPDFPCLWTRHWVSHRDLSIPSTLYLKIHFLFYTPHCLLTLLRPSLSLICFLTCFSVSLLLLLSPTYIHFPCCYESLPSKTLIWSVNPCLEMFQWVPLASRWRKNYWAPHNLPDWSFHLNHYLSLQTHLVLWPWKCVGY